MHILNNHNVDSQSPRLPSVLAAVLFLVVALAAGCRKPAPQIAPAAGPASPAVANQPAERTPDELALMDAAIKGDTGAGKSLLDRGVNANTKDPDGRTPLTEAVWNNNADLVRLLLDRGANPNAKKNDGATPLSIARGKGSKEILGLLQKAGAK